MGNHGAWLCFPSTAKSCAAHIKRVAKPRNRAPRSVLIQDTFANDTFAKKGVSHDLFAVSPLHILAWTLTIQALFYGNHHKHNKQKNKTNITQFTLPCPGCHSAHSALNQTWLSLSEPTLSPLPRPPPTWPGLSMRRVSVRTDASNLGTGARRRGRVEVTTASFIFSSILRGGGRSPAWSDWQLQKNDPAAEIEQPDFQIYPGSCWSVWSRLRRIRLSSSGHSVMYYGWLRQRNANG